MDTKDMFEGFEAFGSIVAPEGAVTVQYGLSVDTVQIVGEATAAPVEGMNPVALAEKMAKKFNMPSQGLRVFVDGSEVSFTRETVIPATAKTIEFRQPGSEKGAILLPMVEWFTIEIIALDVTETWLPHRTEQVVGSIVDPTLLTLPKGIETRSGSNGFDLIKVSEAAELANTSQVARFVSQVRKTGAMTAKDLFAAIEGKILAIVVDGKRAENLEMGYDCLLPGQVCRIFVQGETTKVDLPVIVTSAAQPAPEAVEESNEDYTDKRRGELEGMAYRDLQQLHKEFTGKQKPGSKAKLVEAILKAEGYVS